MKQPECQAGHLNPYSAYVENSWTYHSTPPFAFMLYIGTNFSLGRNYTFSI